MIGLLARIRSLVGSLRRRSSLDAEMDEEFRNHIELRTQDLVRTGLARREASRRAHLEFGHVEAHKERARAARGLRWIDQTRFSWIDVKLGARMLRKNPMLTAVALFALGIGIPVGLAPWQIFHALTASPLPVEDGDRIRAIRYYNGGFEGPLARAASAFELELWREELASFETLGGYQSAFYTVSGTTGAGVPVRGAKVTASAFDMLRVPPLLGRTLGAADEVVGAADVVVIGHDIWQDRLGGAPDVVGSTLAVSGTPYTVVGVMPAGFRFPHREHLWFPLRLEATSGPGDGEPIWIFGRLADGVGEDEANVEVAVAGSRIDAAFPGERAGWRAEVVGFGGSLAWIPRASMLSVPEFFGAQLAAVFLLLVTCANVAILVFARGATRFREIAVRAALGASRRRIVAQMFAESLILTLAATGAGLLVSDLVVGRLFERAVFVDGSVEIPYWLDLGVTPEVALVALVLGALCAVIAGILPALKITGGDLHRDLQTSRLVGVRFGRVSTAFIVLDVALAVSAVGLATVTSNRLLQRGRNTELVGTAAEEYLAVEVELSAGGSSGAASAELRAQRAAIQTRLVERLEAEPGVRAVALGEALPRMEHPGGRVALDDQPLGPENEGRPIHVVEVDVGYFDALRATILAGRGFAPGDDVEGASVAVVNRAYVEAAMGGGNPLGRRLRIVGDSLRWYEVVGMVGPLGVQMFSEDGGEAVYLPTPPGEIDPLRLAIHLGAAPEQFTPRLRAIVSQVDPWATIEPPIVLSREVNADWYLGLALQGLLTLLILILLSLAVSGLYAILSFTVSQRMREIGVRTALGAGRNAIAITVASRAIRQIGLGVLAGTPVVVWMFVRLRSFAGFESGATTALAALFPGILVLVLVSVLACSAPVARALRVHPNEVLKAEG